MPHQTTPTRVYLDNAATTWPKPETVYQAVDQYQREIGAAAGRAAYRHAVQSSQIIDRARTAIADLVHAPANSQVIFTFNGTDSLNLCLHGLLRPHDHVVTSAAEHNSVLRPLRTLERRLGLDLTYVPCNEAGVVELDSIRAAMNRRKTRLVALTHASNVTGAIQPIEAAAELAHQHGALVLVDAAQTLGHLPVNLTQLPIDMLAGSGHKGLLGPLGTGLAVLTAEVAAQMDSVRQGGTGTDSEDDRQPTVGPEKFESGNLNVAGIAGLLAGVQFVVSQGSVLRQHELEITQRLVERLSDMSQLKLLGPDQIEQRVGVVSLTIRGHDCHELAAILDTVGGIQVRAGLHCAPRMHQRLGTLAQGGTVRVSVGPFNTAEHIDQLCLLLASIVDS